MVYQTTTHQASNDNLGMKKQIFMSQQPHPKNIDIVSAVPSQLTNTNHQELSNVLSPTSYHARNGSSVKSVRKYEVTAHDKNMYHTSGVVR